MDIIKFLKELMGFESKEDSMIGLAKFNNTVGFNDSFVTEKVFVKKEPTLTQMLKRANY